METLKTGSGRARRRLSRNFWVRVRLDGRVVGDGYVVRDGSRGGGPDGAVDFAAGEGFVDRMGRELDANWKVATAILAPFEEQMGAGVGAFLTGRIGLADFSLYGQLHLTALTKELKLPASMPHLRAFYARMDRITASVEPPAL